jgi:hypothetical protein
VYANREAKMKRALSLIFGLMLFAIRVSSAAVGWANYQWPCFGASYANNQNIDIYSRTWKPGCTEAPGPCSDLEAWLFYKRADQSYYTQVGMFFDAQVGNNDEFTAQIPYYYTQAGIQELYYIRFHDLSDDTWYDPADHCGGGSVPPMVLNITPATAQDVTVIFRVNINCLSPDLYSGGMFFSGDFIGWPPCSTAAQMSDSDNDGIYQGQWLFPAGSNPHHEYKHNSSGTNGCNWENSIPNRVFTIDDSQSTLVLPTVLWDNWDCDSLCACAVPEQEPNDTWPPIEILSLSLVSCGTITSPQDADLWRFQPSSPTAVRITMTHEPGLHPAVEIFTEDSVSFASATDCTNVATEFTSDFKFGAYPYVFRVGGLNGTTGCYHIRVDPIQLPQVPPPSPLVTIRRAGNDIVLRWQASYFAGEQMQIWRAVSPGGPFNVLAGTAQANANSFTDVGALVTDKAFYLLEATGSRDQDPFVGSVISLGQLTDIYGNAEELRQFQVEEIEWAVTDSNDLAMSRLKAHEVSPGNNYRIDQDIRSHYGAGLTAVPGFAGHNFRIWGRHVSLDYLAIAHDSTSGQARIVDARGRDAVSNTTLLFGGAPQLLAPNNGGHPVSVSGDSILGCGQLCCDLQWLFLCQSSGRPRPVPPPPELACEQRLQGFWITLCNCHPNEDPNQFFYNGCPCPPPPPPPPPSPPPAPAADSLYCTAPSGDTCVTCIGRYADLGSFRYLWCVCPRDTIPTDLASLFEFMRGPRYCMWQMYVKCGCEQCQPAFPPCGCPVVHCPRINPAFPADVWVPPPPNFGMNALRAACRQRCVPGTQLCTND